MSSYPPLPPNFDAGDLAALQMENIELKNGLRNLVDALPKCDVCGTPATRRAFVHGYGRWCDEHSPRVRIGLDDKPLLEPPEYPRAAPLREAIALLERHGGGRCQGAAGLRCAFEVGHEGPHLNPDFEASR